MIWGDTGIQKHSGIVKKGICVLESYTCTRTRQNGGTEEMLWIKHCLSQNFWDRIALLGHFWVSAMKSAGLGLDMNEDFCKRSLYFITRKGINMNGIYSQI